MKVRTRVVWVAAAAVWGYAGVASAAEAWEAPSQSVTPLPIVLPPAPSAYVAPSSVASVAAPSAPSSVSGVMPAPVVAVTAVAVPVAAPVVPPAVATPPPAPTGAVPTATILIPAPAVANLPPPAASGSTVPRAIIVVPSLAEIPDQTGPDVVGVQAGVTTAAPPAATSANPTDPTVGRAETWADPFAPLPVTPAPGATAQATGTTTTTSVETLSVPAPQPSPIRYVGRRYTGLPEDYRLGMGLLVGGGVVDFARSTIQDMTATGGTWDARLVFGARDVLGLETAYVGSARNIRTLGLGSDALLVSNGAEGVLRLNIPVIDGASIIEPFAFAGIGWSRYEISRNALNTSNVAAADDVLEVPYGAGLTIGYAGFLADVRFTYRATYYNDLLRSASASNESKRLDSWSLGVHIGFEF